VPDVIWASPDCTTYSIAAISTHRIKEDSGNLAPKSDYAKQCDEINSHVIELINELKPKFYFIENPRGGMRKMWFM
jgi:site-specific DNA-cytosine methylase